MGEFQRKKAADQKRTHTLTEIFKQNEKKTPSNKCGRSDNLSHLLAWFWMN